MQYFSDGCGGQYKNKKHFLNLCHHKEYFKSNVSGIFFATSYGKSPCDGIGGTDPYLKAEVEKNIEGCKVILSLLMQRVDKLSANKIIQKLNKKIQSLGINAINNDNISINDIGRKGLHLNMKGINKLVSNIAAKVKSI